MTASEIHACLRRRPFLPFRVHVTGDVYYDVREPEMAMVGMSVFILGQRRNIESEYFDEPVLVALRHITRIEPLLEAADTPAA